MNNILKISYHKLKMNSNSSELTDYFDKLENIIEKINKTTDDEPNNFAKIAWQHA